MTPDKAAGPPLSAKMAFPGTDYLVTRLAMHGNRDLVAHRAGWQENCLFHSKEAGHPFAQFQGLWVLVVALITGFDIEDRLSHCPRRAGLRIGIKINHSPFSAEFILRPKMFLIAKLEKHPVWSELHQAGLYPGR